MVAGDGSIGSDNLLGASIGLNDGSSNGNVLADGETEDGVVRRELEPVTGTLLLTQHFDQCSIESTYMATLWEMTVFSWSSNSWKTSGFRTFFTSALSRVD